MAAKKQPQNKPADREREHQTLDEVLETLQEFTQRCEILLDPFVKLTNFLSTQSSATSATTRPALLSLLLRILALSPIRFTFLERGRTIVPRVTGIEVCVWGQRLVPTVLTAWYPSSLVHFVVVADASR